MTIRVVDIVLRVNVIAGDVALMILDRPLDLFANGGDIGSVEDYSVGVL